RRPLVDQHVVSIQRELYGPGRAPSRRALSFTSPRRPGVAFPVLTAISTTICHAIASGLDSKVYDLHGTAPRFPRSAGIHRLSCPALAQLLQTEPGGIEGRRGWQNADAARPGGAYLPGGAIFRRLVAAGRRRGNRPAAADGGAEPG